MTQNPAPDWLIRAAIPADHAAIGRMNDAIQQYERDLLGAPMLEPELVSAHYLAGMFERVAQRDGEMMVCVIECEIAGCVCGYRAEDDDVLIEAGFQPVRARVRPVRGASLSLARHCPSPAAELCRSHAQ